MSTPTAGRRARPNPSTPGPRVSRRKLPVGVPVAGSIDTLQRFTSAWLLTNATVRPAAATPQAISVPRVRRSGGPAAPNEWGTRRWRQTFVPSVVRPEKTIDEGAIQAGGRSWKRVLMNPSLRSPAMMRVFCAELPSTGTTHQSGSECGRSRAYASRYAPSGDHTPYRTPRSDGAAGRTASPSGAASCRPDGSSSEMNARCRPSGENRPAFALALTSRGAPPRVGTSYSAWPSPSTTV